MDKLATENVSTTGLYRIADDIADAYVHDRSREPSALVAGTVDRLRLDDSLVDPLCCEVNNQIYLRLYRAQKCPGVPADSIRVEFPLATRTVVMSLVSPRITANVSKQVREDADRRERDRKARSEAAHVDKSASSLTLLLNDLAGGARDYVQTLTGLAADGYDPLTVHEAVKECVGGCTAEAENLIRTMYKEASGEPLCMARPARRQVGVARQERSWDLEKQADYVWDIPMDTVGVMHRNNLTLPAITLTGLGVATAAALGKLLTSISLQASEAGKRLAQISTTRSSYGIF